MRGSKYIVLLLISCFTFPIFFSFVFASNNIINDNNLTENHEEIRTVANSANTTFVSEYDHYFGWPDDLFVHDDLVYVLDRNLGIEIYDLATFQLSLIKYIERESIVGDFNVSYSPSGGIHLYKHENVLFINLDYDGLLMLNITDSLTLDPLYYFEDINVKTVLADDDFLYILSDNDTISLNSYFYIFDISNILTPLEIACYKFDNEYDGMVIQDNFVFFNDYNSNENGVTILDISVHSSPVVVVNIQIEADKLFVHNDCLIVASKFGEDILQFYNISTITNPIPTANITVDVYPTSYFSYFDDELIFISFYKSHVLNFTDIYAPSIKAIYNMTFDKLYTVEQFSWLIDSKLMLRIASFEILIFNYTSFTDFEILNIYTYDLSTKQIELVDNYAFISTGKIIEIIDIKNPQTPEVISSFSAFSFIEDFVIYDDLLLIADSYIGLRVVNISDYWNPTLISSTVQSVELTRSIAYNNESKIVYLGYDDSLRIINLIDPRYPEVIATISTDKVEQIVYENNYLYVHTQGPDWGLNKLKIFDVSEITNPKLNWILNLGSWGEIYVENHLLFINSEKIFHTDGDNPLTILDVSDPYNPGLVYYYNETSILTYEFLIDNDILYVCNHHNLMLFDIQFLDSIKVINHTNDMIYPFPNSIAKSGDYLYVSKVWDGLGIYLIEFTYSEITLTFTQTDLITLRLFFLTSMILLPIIKNRRKKKD